MIRRPMITGNAPGGGTDRQHAAEEHNGGPHPAHEPGRIAATKAIVEGWDRKRRRSGSAEKRSGQTVSSGADLTTSRQYDLRMAMSDDNPISCCRQRPLALRRERKVLGMRPFGCGGARRSRASQTAVVIGSIARR